MNTAVILLVCGSIALHCCKGYDADVEEGEEEESMCAEIVRQMYESIPWSALSHKSVREALHTLTEYVTSRKARSLVRNFVLDVWSEREGDDNADFLNSFLHFLRSVSSEPKVLQATHRILTFLQSSLQGLAQPPQEYDEEFLPNVDNILEQTDVFNKEEQYKEYEDEVIERNGILKTQDIRKILRDEPVDHNLAIAGNDLPTAWTDTSSLTQPAIATTDNLLVNKIMNHRSEINKTDKSSNMEIIIKLQDKPLGQINVEVKQATPVNMHGKYKSKEKYIRATTRGNTGVKQANDKSKKESIMGTPNQEDTTSIPFPNLEQRHAKDQNKKEDVAVTPLPTCPLVTEVDRPGPITASVPDTHTSNQRSAERSFCDTQELKLHEWEKVAFLSLIRAVILKEKYKICKSISDKISQSILPLSPRESLQSNTSQVTDKEKSVLINITPPNLQTEYSSAAITNYVSVSPLSDTQLMDKDGLNKSVPNEVTSIRPDASKINNTQDLNSYMNFFSKLLHKISNDSVTPRHDDITEGNDESSISPLQLNSTDHVSSSTSTPSDESVSHTTPHVANRFKDNLQEFIYVLKNLPMEAFKSRREDRGPQPPQTSSNIAADKMNPEDVNRINSPGPFMGNVEPVLIYRTSDQARKQKPRQHHGK